MSSAGVPDEQKKYVIGFGMKMYCPDRNKLSIFSDVEKYGIKIYDVGEFGTYYFFLKKATWWNNSNENSDTTILRIVGSIPAKRIIKTIIESKNQKTGEIETTENTITTETYEPEAIENRKNIEDFCKNYGFSIDNWKIIAKMVKK